MLSFLKRITGRYAELDMLSLNFQIIWENTMASELIGNFSIGQPLEITLIDSDNSKTYPSRILEISSYTLTFSIPYETGKMVLWPIGSRLEISIAQSGGYYTFNTEVIGRDLGEIKSYTVMRPYAISLATRRMPNEGMSRVIAVTSGKGGVGKTVFTINLAIALAAQGQRVFIIDTDLGTANVDVLLRLSPKYNLTHLLTGDKNLLDITLPGPGNIAVIPGGSGLQELTQMSDRQFAQVINSFNQLDGLADIILLDTGAGISRDVSNFLLAADEIILITTPEPHAITDAYAITKVMHNLKCQAKQMLVINRAEHQIEADNIAARLLTVMRQYLKAEAEYIGYITDDRIISRSLKEQRPLMLSYPAAIPARNINDIASRLLHRPVAKPAGITGFVNKMIALFNKKMSF